MSPYVHEDYREILRAFFAQKKARSGIKSDFSKALGIKTSYLSQILSGSVHLTPEQALRASLFIGFSENETEYFLLCVQVARTYDASLNSFFKKKLEQLKNKNAKALSADSEMRREDIDRYHSHWLYAAIYETLSKTTGTTAFDLQKIFQHSRPQIQATLEFLIACGLVKRLEDKFFAQKKLIPPSTNPLSKKSFQESCHLFALNSTESSIKNSIQKSVSGRLSKKEIQAIVEENLRALDMAGEKTVLFNLDVIIF